jgi:type IV pilus assembly protein PilA
MARRRDGDEGFTLIELMVVVLIIAILIAIAIPTFLGARQRAQNRAAQSSLRNGLTAAKTIFTDRENYTDATTAALLAVEPSLTFTAGASSGQNDVSVATTATSFTAAALSRSGTCYFIQDTVTGGTQYASTTSGTCGAGSAPATWTTSW